MGIIERIRAFVAKPAVLAKDQVKRLAHMPKDQAQKELGELLYDHCVQRAAGFVKGELKRGDSPYRETEPETFFHEILSVTFWLLDKKAAGGKQLILQEMHAHYLSSFSSSKARQNRQQELDHKCMQYEEMWNDITGHFDDFGLTVVQNIFGREESLKTRERTFWVIQYADQCADDFCRFHATWKEITTDASS